jgi:AhpD family alkylhydroperoxidase
VLQLPLDATDQRLVRIKEDTITATIPGATDGAEVYSRSKIPAEGERQMMIDWNEYHKEIATRLGELMKLSPDTVRGYQTLSAANSKTGKLDEKTRQLISLAVAVTTHCDGCIVVHSEAALKAGATKDEIAEALGVAVAMNAGAALIYSTRVLDAVNAKSSQVQTA